MGAEGSARLWGAAQPPPTDGLLDRPLSRRQLLRGAGLGGVALIAPSWPRAARLPPAVSSRGVNVVVRWNNAVLQAVRDSKLGPPMVARALAIVHTCVYDAWAAYDNVAIGTRLGGSLRRPAGERTLENKSVAGSRGDPQRRRERGARLPAR